MAAVVFSSLLVVLLNPFGSDIDSSQASHSASDHHYVAFGDSLTTGYSIKSCTPDSGAPHGCKASEPPPARPYPEIVADELRLPLNRVGIWGYKASEAAAYKPGPGGREPMLDTVIYARDLVTGTLGINDVQGNAAEKAHLLMLYKRFGAGGVRAHMDADHIPQLAPHLDTIFQALNWAKEGGARVIVPLYYNFYDSPRSDCQALYRITDVVVSKVNAALKARAEEHGLEIADFRTPFRNHGSGSGSEWTFGTECNTDEFFETYESSRRRGNFHSRSARDAQVRFDPHPNPDGTRQMANAIKKAFSGGHVTGGIDHGFSRSADPATADFLTAWTRHDHGGKYAAIWLCRTAAGAPEPACQDHPNHDYGCDNYAEGWDYASCSTRSDDPAHGVSDTLEASGRAPCPEPGYVERAWADYSDGHGICSHDMKAG